MAFITAEIKRQLVDSVIHSMTTDRHYIFAARSYPFADDFNPPEVEGHARYEHYDVYRDIIFGKFISPSDILPMTERNDWQAGKVFDAYDDKETDPLKSRWIVSSIESDQTISVFKCLNNRLDGIVVPASYRPRKTEVTPDDEQYITGDGYVWKFLFNIPLTTVRKFASERYLPVIEDPAVTARAKGGTIDSMLVVNGGGSYNSWTVGAITDPAVAGNTMIYGISPEDGYNLSSNTGFYEGSDIIITQGRGAGQVRRVIAYVVTGSARRVVLNQSFTTIPDLSSRFEINPSVTVDGDGEGAIAVTRVNPNGNTISSIEVINTGASYTFANVRITGNTGYINPTPEFLAEARPIISPPSGHGGDIYSEVRTSAVGISVSISGNEANTVPASNDYRTFGIVKKPLFNRVDIEIADSAFIFGDGDRITQPATGATAEVYNRVGGVVGLTKVDGQFVVGSPVRNQANVLADVTGVSRLTTTFDNRVRVAISMIDTGPAATGFLPDEAVIQDKSKFSGKIFTVDDDQITVVNPMYYLLVSDSITGTIETIRGETSGATAEVLAVVQPDIIPASGRMLYIENTHPITRDNGQTETIRLVIDV